WHAFYRRAYQEANGSPDEKHGAAYSETVGPWLLLHPPAQRAGLCSQCWRPLDPPQSTYDAAPLRLEGCCVHFGCAKLFVRERWDRARVKLQCLGISGGEF